jgi:ABC-2 type transport system ATP-binding protein
MNGRVRTRVAVLTGSLALLAAGAAPAQARDAIVPSFDGTPIVVTFHPAQGLQAGRRAPTILQTHGWGGNRERDPNAGNDETTGNVGVGPLRRAGFNVLTWDSRGFGESGGTVTVDSKDFEGRDVQALLDWLARQPEAQLDRAGDPRAGMHGVSYAGGIELVAAGLDGRIDAIAPSIAWNSLLTSLYKEETVKTGWGTLLYAGGLPTATLEGAVSPAGMQTGTLDPHITSAFVNGASTGKFSAEDKAWFASRGLPELVGRIRTPTPLVQGTADTLFTPSEAIRNYEVLSGNGVPVKMLWFCGGHGECRTGQGPAGRIEAAVVAWMKRHLAGDRSVDTGPGFEWLADDARWRSAPAFPPGRGAPITAEGSGTLNFSPADALSGDPIAARPAVNAVNVPIGPQRREAQVVGEPRVTLTYSGSGPVAQTHVFAQVADDARGLVLGNQVTPLPVTLDGARHTVTRRLEGVAAAGGRYRLQLIGGSQVYGPVRGLGAITFATARVGLPATASP